MDSPVKQLQQVIPLKIQTMEIKFAPLQTAHLSRAFKLLPTSGRFSAVVSLPLANHLAFTVMEHIRGWIKLCKCTSKTSSNYHKYLQDAKIRRSEVENVHFDLQPI